MKNKKTVGLLILAGLLLMAGPVFGQEAATEGYSSIWLDNEGAAKLGAAIGAGLVLMGGGAGIARVGSAAAESMARQPDASGSINGVAIILAAMIEGATLFGVIVCLLCVVL